jgi:hypothetical protein
MPIKPHNKYLHDHLGWPEPARPDHICQVWVPFKPEPCLGIDAELPRHFHPRRFIDLKGIVPIHLIREGYTSFEVSFAASDQMPKGEDILVDAYANEREDWVVRVNLDVNDRNAVKKPMKYKMTVIAYMTDDEDRIIRRDIVALTDLIVLPAGYDIYDPQEQED